jgi:uncharacterized protein (DUF1499 family)
MNFVVPARLSMLLPPLLISLLLAGCASAARTTEPAAGELATNAASTLQCTLPSNCVNSIGDGAMAPLRFSGTAAQGMTQLQTVLRSFPEATVVPAMPTAPQSTAATNPAQSNDSVLETIFTTPIGFKDKVTFIIDARAGRIDFRSGSTLGLYDFGKNRSRMTEFASRFERSAAK